MTALSALFSLRDSAWALLREQFLRVRACLRSNLVSAQHSRELLDPLAIVEWGEFGRYLITVSDLCDAIVAIGAGGHLRQVRDTQHLPS